MNAAFSKYYHNTPEEEAEIQRGIELDPDTFDLSDETIELKPILPVMEPKAETEIAKR